MYIRRADGQYMVNVKFLFIEILGGKNICKIHFVCVFSETTITKDNPAFSMVNDSDEDVIYGSDDDSRRPLNSSTGKGNDYDSD